MEGRVAVEATGVNTGACGVVRPQRKDMEETEERERESNTEARRSTATWSARRCGGDTVGLPDGEGSDEDEGEDFKVLIPEDRRSQDFTERKRVRRGRQEINVR